MTRGSSFLLSSKSRIICLFVNGPLPEQVSALHVTHVHNTLTTAVSLRLLGDCPNLCPKTEGRGMAKVKPRAYRAVA